MKAPVILIAIGLGMAIAPGHVVGDVKPILVVLFLGIGGWLLYSRFIKKDRGGRIQ